MNPRGCRADAECIILSYPATVPRGTRDRSTVIWSRADLETASGRFVFELRIQPPQLATIRRDPLEYKAANEMLLRRLPRSLSPLSQPPPLLFSPLPSSATPSPRQGHRPLVQPAPKQPMVDTPARANDRRPGSPPPSPQLLFSFQNSFPSLSLQSQSFPFHPSIDRNGAVVPGSEYWHALEATRGAGGRRSIDGAGNLIVARMSDKTSDSC
eukprot:754704-Hanusia_phi.AAC.1